MKFIFTVFILMYYTVGFCQNVSPTRRQLSKLFKLSIDQESKKSVRVGSGAWTICNQDSSFFKSDTLRLYSNMNYFYQLSSCCNFIEWTFYKKNAFVQSKLQICKEPPTGSLVNDFFQISIFSEKNTVYLLVIRPNKSSEKFRLIEIEDVKLADNNSSKVITLKRITTYPFFIH